MEESSVNGNQCNRWVDGDRRHGGSIEKWKSMMVYTNNRPSDLTVESIYEDRYLDLEKH